MATASNASSENATTASRMMNDLSDSSSTHLNVSLTTVSSVLDAPAVYEEVHDLAQDVADMTGVMPNGSPVRKDETTAGILACALAAETIYRETEEEPYAALRSAGSSACVDLDHSRRLFFQEQTIENLACLAIYDLALKSPGHDMVLESPGPKRAFVLAFRGTKSALDVALDGAFLACEATAYTHSGFYKVASTAKSKLGKQIKDHYDQWRKDYPKPAPSYITGHSMGGAVAQVFCQLNARAGSCKELAEFSKVISFGSPLIGIGGGSLNEFSFENPNVKGMLRDELRDFSFTTNGTPNQTMAVNPIQFLVDRHVPVIGEFDIVPRCLGNQPLYNSFRKIVPHGPSGASVKASLDHALKFKMFADNLFLLTKEHKLLQFKVSEELTTRRVLTVSKHGLSDPVHFHSMQSVYRAGVEKFYQP